MMHKTNGKIISSNRPNWWEKSPKYENTTFREYTQMYVSMKKVKLWNICETQLQVSISWVALYSLLVRCCSSPWWHLHLSPPYDVLDHASHIFSESSSCWQPVPPCSEPVTPSTNQYHPLLTKYSMIWWFRPCKPNIFWKYITLAANTALFWSSITKYRPVPPYTDAVPPSNNHCCPLPTKYNQVLISTA